LTIKQFAKRVQEGEQASLRKAGMACKVNLDNCITEIKSGRKWTKINVGRAGKFMINPDGYIFGVKAYGVPNLRHCYGTLANPSEACFQGLWG